MENKLRFYRGQAGYSLEQLAAIAGVSRYHLADLEKGKNMPGLALADRLCAVLDRTVYEVWPGLLSRLVYEQVIEDACEEERERVRASIIKTSEVFLKK